MYINISVNNFRSLGVQRNDNKDDFEPSEEKSCISQDVKWSCQATYVHSTHVGSEG